MNIFKYLFDEFSKHLNITSDKENEQTVIDNIRHNVEFRGANLWILIFAILIASIGLNIDSTPVIIGAMLISPIMGPIMGIGLSIGINDLELIKRSMRNLLIAAIFAIIAAAIYFWISPINEAKSELLARTSPTLYDVLIAFIGGAAGFLAMSTTGNHIQVIIGAAISTALLPPLCTVGFGVATGDWLYAIGALYLFLINSVFIAISTFVSVRLFKYSRKEFTDKKREIKVRHSLIAISVIALVPSIILTYNIVSKTIFTENAEKFIENELKFPGTQIIEKNISYSPPSIQAIFIGEYIPKILIETVEDKLPEYHLNNTKLTIIQERNNRDSIITDYMQRYTQNKAYAHEEQLNHTQQLQIDSLKNIIADIYRYHTLDSLIYEEIKILYPSIQSLSLGYAWQKNNLSNNVTPHTFAYIQTYDTATEEFRKRIDHWLKQRTNNDKIEIIWSLYKTKERD